MSPLDGHLAGEDDVRLRADASDRARILPLSVPTATAYVCSATGDTLTPALWHTYIPQLPYDPPCARHG